MQFLKTSVHKHKFATLFFKTEHTFFTFSQRHLNILTSFLRRNPTAAEFYHLAKKGKETDKVKVVNFQFSRRQKTQIL